MMALVALWDPAPAAEHDAALSLPLPAPVPGPSEEVLRARFWGATACFLLGSYVVAMVTDDLGVVFALIGATGATIITYILPGAAYYKMHPPGCGPAWMRTVAAAYVVFGCCVMFFCVTIILI
jgi:amino acid permease